MTLPQIIFEAKVFSRFLRKKFSKIALPDYTTFSIFAVFIGAAAGLAAVLFHKVIEFLNTTFFNNSGDPFSHTGFIFIIFPAIGMLIQAFMILAAPKTAEKKGVSEIIKAVALRGGYIPFRTTLFHMIAPAVCIGFGGTVGPEGPAAQIGGGVASKLGQLFGSSDLRRRVFTAAGSGAAIAAIFNTPLGGVFFAMEIILLNDFNAPALSALILSSVTASTISRTFLGNQAVFHFNIPTLENYHYFYLYAILGILVGIISILFIRYSGTIEYIFKKRIYASKVPQWLVMTIVGLAVGISGFFYKDIFGIGYSGINHVLSGQLIWETVLIIFLLKFFLVPVIISSGGFGGIFAPSLFLGACTGFLFALAANNLFNLDLDTTSFVLIGMGAMLGGINTIPITAIMIIFEMTQNYSFILPLMLAVIISTTVSRLYAKRSIHVVHLEEQGYLISEGKELNILRTIPVSDAKLEPLELIPESTPFPIVMEKIMNSPNNFFFTVNDKNIISGIITETELRPMLSDFDVRNLLIAGDVAYHEVISVTPKDDLDTTLRLMTKNNIDQLPVIADSPNNKILGVITRQEILTIYNRESLKINLAEGLSKELKTIHQASPASIVKGYSIAEINVPRSFIGKNLYELKIRNKFELEVLMIKHPQELLDKPEERDMIISSNTDYKLKRNDKLVVFGMDKNIERLKNI